MIEKINFYEEYKEPIVLMLGFFDCMHLGHKKLLERAREYKKNNSDIKIAIFTFSDNNIYKQNGTIYTLNERIYLYNKLDIDVVVVADFNEKFKSLSGEAFLNFLKELYNIKAIVVGFDYKFGNNAENNIDQLNIFCRRECIELIIQSAVIYKGEKVSSSLIKKLLSAGDIEKVNTLLCEKYFILGEVTYGRQIGRTIGFPTANINYNNLKSYLKNGVYKVIGIINDKTYSGIANLGSKPTVFDKVLNLEVHFKDFDEDIYGKIIKVIFIKYIREIKKFESLEKLKEQLKKDLDYLYD